ncbi:hypothetical protein HPB48_000633 [Haemaphysalis longicornis]|uniref:Uncharacterized protein n=1 Tax=Haemaphysalis longicornis TaxID=44386 RepID=A0A9J6FPD2_HAELO|nr:hypothetical protein HPB48_000633 [Haemaphysalis longicornis]
MVNSLYDVRVFLEDGANALQADVTFSPNGRAQHTYHGPPCDCYRTCTRDSTIKDYLNNLRVVSSGEGKFQGQVALLYLALYTSHVPDEYHHQAGVDIAEKLQKYLWRGGFDFGGMEPFYKIRDAYAELNITKGRWLGSGNTNCLPYQSGRYGRLESIVDCREGKSRECDFVDKGYAYNLDTQRAIGREIR